MSRHFFVFQNFKLLIFYDFVFSILLTWDHIRGKHSNLSEGTQHVHYQKIIPDPKEAHHPKLLTEW